MRSFVMGPFLSSPLRATYPFSLKLLVLLARFGVLDFTLGSTLSKEGLTELLGSGELSAKANLRFACPDTLPLILHKLRSHFAQSSVTLLRQCETGCD